MFYLWLADLRSLTCTSTARYICLCVWRCFFFSFFLDSVPLCSPGSPVNCIIDQAGLCFSSSGIKGIGHHAWLTKGIKRQFSGSSLMGHVPHTQGVHPESLHEKSVSPSNTDSAGSWLEHCRFLKSLILSLPLLPSCQSLLQPLACYYFSGVLSTLSPFTS